MTQPAPAVEPPPPPPPHPIVARLREQFGEEAFRDEEINGQLIVRAEPGRLLELCAFLRDDAALRFDHLADVTGVDYLLYNPDGGPPGEGRTPRFDVVINLYSIALNHRLRIKVGVDEGQSVPSLVGLWPSANWAERETFDMYGITFDGHPNLTRILTPDDWQTHPLRKDFPLIEEEIEFSETLPRLNLPLRPVHQRSLQND